MCLFVALTTVENSEALEAKSTEVGRGRYLVLAIHPFAFFRGSSATHITGKAGICYNFYQELF